MSNRGPSRRDCLKSAALGIGAAVGSGLLAGCASSSRSIVPAPRRPGSIRVAHLTDFHVQPELDAERGAAACLRHAQAHKPDLILNTGDCVMDTLNADRARTQAQWDVWQRLIKSECSTKIAHCLGNHDIWGWVRDRSGTTGNESGWGKQWAMDVLGLSRPYHAFDHGAWRFIMLDSVQASPEGTWHARFDDQQVDWLESQLAATRKPVLIGSHVPIMSPAAWLDGGRIDGTPEAPALAVRRVHLDVKRMGALFAKHRHVKLCISGHLHEIDRAEFLGVTYLTNPAVCGNWWKGLHRGIFGEMYTLLDLHSDGTFDVQRIDFGWEPAEMPATQPAVAAAARG